MNLCRFLALLLILGSAPALATPKAAPKPASLPTVLLYHQDNPVKLIGKGQLNDANQGIFVVHRHYVTAPQGYNINTLMVALPDGTRTVAVRIDNQSDLSNHRFVWYQTAGGFAAALKRSTVIHKQVSAAR